MTHSNEDRPDHSPPQGRCRDAFQQCYDQPQRRGCHAHASVPFLSLICWLRTPRRLKQQQVQDLGPLLLIETVNALDPDSVAGLATWCKVGRTVALLGSSGVGKSTLINTLLGHHAQQTASIREDDSKGRHTTTGRSIHPLPSGGVLLDTPGMRELQLAECAQGVSETFADIEVIAEHCRFSDCTHEAEPGCAIQLALEQGDIDHRRLQNYTKLLREQARNSASLAELRSQDKALGKMYKTILNESRTRKNK